MNLKTMFAVILITAGGAGLHAQNIDAFKPDFSSPISIAGYTLVWNDEFNINGRPDTMSWKYENGFIRNEELQWYKKDNARCINGVLLIEGRREKTQNIHYDAAGKDWRQSRQFADYTSASIQTAGYHQWQYGRFEIRARIDTAKGAWPAIWTLGANGEWPSNGETDIMEFYRIKNEPSVLANTAWGTSEAYKAKWHTEIQPLSHFTNRDAEWVKKFHVWRMDWNKDFINIYLDDELLNATALDNTVNADGSNPFRRPHFLLLNLAIGGNGGDPFYTKSPIQYEVDYVRVYQEKK